MELEGNCTTDGRDVRGFACRHPQELPRGEEDAEVLWAVWEKREKKSINYLDKVINMELRGKGLSKLAVCGGRLTSCSYRAGGG